MAGGREGHGRLIEVIHNAGELADAVFMEEGFDGGSRDPDDLLSCSYNRTHHCLYVTSLWLIPHIVFSF